MKKYLFAVVVGLATTAHAQQPSPVLKTGGTFFALSVASMDSTVRWYQEKLGLSVAMQVARTDATKASMTLLRGGGLTIEIIQHDEAAAVPDRKSPIFTHGIFKVGFESTTSIKPSMTSGSAASPSRSDRMRNRLTSLLTRSFAMAPATSFSSSAGK